MYNRDGKSYLYEVKEMENMMEYNKSLNILFKLFKQTKKIQRKKSSLGFYIKYTIIGFISYKKFKKIHKLYSLVFNKPKYSIELIKIIIKEALLSKSNIELIIIKCEKILNDSSSGLLIRLIISKIYREAIEVKKYLDKFEEIQLDSLEEEAAMLDPNKKITPRPYRIYITLSFYILSLAVLTILVILKIIPFISSIVGYILGINFFFTALNDYKTWRKEYAE